VRLFLVTGQSQNLQTRRIKISSRCSMQPFVKLHRFLHRSSSVIKTSIKMLKLNEKYEPGYGWCYEMGRWMYCMCWVVVMVVVMGVMVYRESIKKKIIFVLEKYGWKFKSNKNEFGRIV